MALSVLNVLSKNSLISGLPGLLVPIRSIYYDRNTCKPHSHPDMFGRFFRLRWGGWIRARAGLKRKLWRKPFWLRSWAGAHVFVKDHERDCLERAIAPIHKKTRYFIDDIYEPYHKRTNLDMCPVGRDSVKKSYIKVLQERM